MCRVDSSLDHRPKVGLPSHSAPQPLLEASVVTTFLLCAVSRFTGSSNGSGLIHRPESLLRGYTVTPSKLLLEPSVSLDQNEPVVEVVEYADSHLSQRGESRIHASCKSAGARDSPNGRTLY